MRAERESEEAHFPMEKVLDGDVGSYMNQELGEQTLPGTTWKRRQADLEKRRIVERTQELWQFRDA
eukprot:4811648-Heterocapsa_arctica.AAC.1